MTNQTMDELKALIADREEELRELYKQFYTHPHFYKLDKTLFAHLSASQKAGLFSSIAACWDAWVVKKGDELTADCFAIAQRWMLEKGHKYQHLNLSLGDVALRFQTFRNKRLKAKTTTDRKTGSTNE